MIDEIDRKTSKHIKILLKNLEVDIKLNILQTKQQLYKNDFKHL